MAFAQAEPIMLDANPSDPKLEASNAQCDKIGHACCCSRSVADPLETSAEFVVTNAMADG